VPVIEILSPLEHPPPTLLDDLCTAIARDLGLPTEHVWAVWTGVPPGHFRRAEWEHGSIAPIVFVRCKSRYSQSQRTRMMYRIRDMLADQLRCESDHVYVHVQRIEPGAVLVRGAVWDDGQEVDMPIEEAMIRR
jgi:phenylpyruvate tautomerase PptA (4-oxalocrotonate tautomerase family)